MTNLAEAAAERNAPPATTADSTGPHALADAPLRVLLVENDEQDASTAIDGLQADSASPVVVHHVDTLATALPLLESEGYDAVLLDLQLPDSQGIETLRRALDVTDQLPVVALSDYCSTSFALQAVQAGAQDFVGKWSESGRSLHRVVHYAVERNRAQRQLRYLAAFDGLTGLSNRQQFHNALRKSCALASRQQQTSALLMIDLDRFKLVNDTYGHDAGDMLLKEVARRLQGCVRKSDTVARLGGDEFAIILEAPCDEYGARVVAEKILESWEAPVALPECEHAASGSIGIAVFPTDADNGETLLKNADIAMYQAKTRAGSSYQFFTDEINRLVAERNRLESELLTAIREEQFCLHYQPQFDTISGELVGLEALIRWQHPERGLTMPGEFIGMAESLGAIGDIGLWVLKSACRQAAAWHRAGLFNHPVSVNVSPLQFTEGFAERVLDALRDTGWPAELLQLEITEAVLLSDSAHVLRDLNELRAHGVKICLDDFGVGYSSLYYLHRFPIDILKIDRFFVQSSAHTDDRLVLILKTIVRLADGLGMKTVAEGVETPAQLERIRAYGCGTVQGFLLAKPESTDSVQARLEQGDHA
ncbi:MAG: EAL domain-containing protein [Pseudomonadota bacterium]